MKKLTWGILFAAVALPASAQERSDYMMPEAYRDVQVRQLESQRRLFVAMADSMPVNLYRDKVTPIQRDFANQLFHAVNTVPAIAAGLILGTNAPFRPDTARVFNDATAMVAFINRVYDWAAEELRAQPADARNENIGFFGLNVPRWQVWDEIHQHSLWTAGQIVANFRKHGMAPPGFGFF